MRKILFALFVSCGLAQGAVSLSPGIGLSQNVTYVQAAGSQLANGNALLAANNAAPAGQLIRIGPGVFDIGSNIMILKHGVTYEGCGRNVTILNGTNNSSTTPFVAQWIPQSATIRSLTLRCRDGNYSKMILGREQSVGFASSSATNFLAEDVHFEGDTDGLYFQGFDDGTSHGSYAFNNCLFTSGFDVLWLSGGNTNVVWDFDNCIFRIDLIGQTNTMNSVTRAARWLIVGGSGPGGRVNFRSCTYQARGATNNVVVEEQDPSGFAAPMPYYITMMNCAISVIPTNSTAARVIFHDALAWDITGTNLHFDLKNVNPIERVETGAISTNRLGNLIVLLSSSAIRTNYLPAISFAGHTNHVDMEQAVKDHNGNAGAANISVRALGGATIDGAAVYTISANYGVAKFRTVGTNWMRVSQ